MIAGPLFVFLHCKSGILSDMDTAQKRTAIIGAAVLGLIVIGLIVWYMASNPPKPLPIGEIPAPGTIDEVTGQKKVVTDQGTYFEAEVAYPSTTPLRASAGAEVDAAAVALMQDFAVGEIDRFKENTNVAGLSEEEIEMFGLNDGRKYALGIDYSMTTSPKTVSYVYTIYQDTLGAHPNAYYRTFTFDSKTGALVTLDTLFTGNYLERLSQIARAELPRIISELTGAEADLEYIESGTLPIYDSFQNFAIEGSTFVLIFPPYQVGPYALGTQVVEIPLSQLSDVLNPAYQ